MNTVPTTIRMQPSVLERLRFFAQERGRTMSEIMEEGVNHVLEQYESQRLDRLYEGLKQLDGIGDPSITDASTTIDEVLYGEQRAWKGKRA